MSLDGLRAWIGEVERKLGVRTRVFLVLVAIAIGGAGAGIYLALDAGDKASGEADVAALEERVSQLEAQETSATDPRVTELEAEVEALQEQVDRLEREDSGNTKGGNEASDETGDEASDEAEESDPAPSEIRSDDAPPGSGATK